MTDFEEATAEMSQWGLVLPPDIGGNEGDGPGGDGDLYIQASKLIHAIQSDSAHF